MKSECKAKIHRNHVGILVRRRCGEKRRNMGKKEEIWKEK